jgi:hypothetical protein
MSKRPDQMSNDELKAHWTNEVAKILKGKKIVDVRYLDDDEMENLGWYKRPLAFELEDGTLCIPSRDDEGNDGGSLFYFKNGDLDVLPVI